MKKSMVYVVAAIVFGVVLTLIPLVTFAKITGKNNYANPGVLCEEFKRLETPQRDASKFSVSDVKIFAASFVIALVVYVLFKRRTSSYDYTGIKPYPY